MSGPSRLLRGGVSDPHLWPGFGCEDKAIGISAGMVPSRMASVMSGLAEGSQDLLQPMGYYRVVDPLKLHDMSDMFLQRPDTHSNLEGDNTLDDTLDSSHSWSGEFDPAARNSHNRKPEPDVTKKDKRGQGYRKLWQQVTKVGKGEKLSEDAGTAFSDMTVEDLLRIITSLPATESAVNAVERGLYYLDSSALAALLKELARQGHIKRSVELFDWLRGLGDSHELSPLCDVYTYTTMISQCGSHQQLRRALELVAEMRGKGIQCNVHTYSAMMNVCIKSKELELAVDVYKQMLQEGCTPNLVTYNTLIDVYVKTGQWEEAVKVLDLMQGQGIQPEVRTYNTIITACNKTGHSEEGLKIYERMLSAGVKPSAATYTTLISAYGKKGQIAKVLEIFQEMVDKGCERNVITYSSLISACERVGQWELGVELFNRMHQENCKPNVVTYNSLIAACANGGQWQKAHDFFQQMVTEGCKPDGITFGALITAFERGGQWRYALKAFEQMQTQGCHPDAVVFNNLLEVLWESGVMVAQMRAAALWSAANKCGQFRIYTQNEPDSSTAVYNCGALTTGAAIVTVLRWLVELRHKLTKDGPNLIKEKVLFKISKSKHNRAEQPSTRICEQLSALLAGTKSPFKVSLVDQATITLECESANLVAWLRSARFTPLQSIVNGGQAKRMSVDYLLSEDITVEQRCSEAFSAVRRYEQAQPLVISPLNQFSRTHMVQTAFKYGNAFGFKDDTVYDALQLVDRLVCSSAGSGVNNNLLPLLVCSCLLIAARQVEPPQYFPAYEHVIAITGYTAEALMGMESHVYLRLNNNTSAFSAVRVAHLLLERLGHFSPDSKQAPIISKDMHALMQKVVCNTVFTCIKPSVLASCIIYAIRKGRGMVPFWPTALQTMTTYKSMGDPEFAGCIAKLEVFLHNECFA